MNIVLHFISYYHYHYFYNNKQINNTHFGFGTKVLRLVLKPINFGKLVMENGLFFSNNIVKMDCIEVENIPLLFFRAFAIQSSTMYKILFININIAEKKKLQNKFPHFGAFNHSS
jgi:hypothetical protein